MRAPIKFILDNAEKFEWSLQGLGMLRLYLSPEMRLHVWSTEYVVPGVTRVHDHPWDFTSHVFSGSITNNLYREAPGALPYLKQAVKCGPGGCALAAPTPIELYCYRSTLYAARESYSERHDEIHESDPEDGTVTVIKRWLPPGANPDIGHVFYPRGTEWVSAESKRATPEEVRAIVSRALDRWVA